jgi:pimeloyl-ACP methyl ester carboxylesterase
MRTMKVDRVAAALLLKALGDHPSPEQALAAFTMPTLVVCGSEDHDNGSAREFAAALPNASYEEIPGTHMSSVTKPDLGEKIAEFLAAV